MAGRGVGRGRGRGLNKPAWMTAGGGGGGGEAGDGPDYADRAARDIVAGLTSTGGGGGGGSGGGGGAVVGRGRGRGRGRGADNRPAWMSRDDGGGPSSSGGGTAPPPARRPPSPPPPSSRMHHASPPPSSSSSSGAGRGRGRGADMNKPAWMTQGGGVSGPGPSSGNSRPYPLAEASPGPGPGPRPSVGSVGRGRGRGRGSDLVKPAWMTAGDSSFPGPGMGHEPAPRYDDRERDREYERERDRERERHGGGDRRGEQDIGAGLRELERLRTEASDRADRERERFNRLKMEESKRMAEKAKAAGASPGGRSSTAVAGFRRAERHDGRHGGREEDERERKRRRKQRDEEDMRRKEKEKKEAEERRKVEKADRKEKEAEEAERRRREEEELRQLEALVADKDDGTSEEDAIFETEEEKEERLARERREKRKKRRREATEASMGGNGDGGAALAKQPKLEDQNDTAAENAVGVTIDQPRNAAGVVASELADAPPPLGAVADHRAAGEKEEENKGVDTPDSFDMFSSSVSPPAASGATAPGEALNGTGEFGAAGISGLHRGDSATDAVAAVDNDAANYDDADGYYRSRIGEVVSLPVHKLDDDDDDDMFASEGKDGAGETRKFRVLGIIGKGVFSTVLKCQPLDGGMAGTDGGGGGAQVAMKLIRSNETMAKAAQKEVRILRLLCAPTKSSKGKSSKGKEKQENDGEKGDGKEGSISEESRREERERNHNIVRLLELTDDRHKDPNRRQQQQNRDPYRYRNLPLLEYRNHVTLLFEHLPYNLRETLTKFGKGVGINLAATKSYARQLLRALSHLERHRIVHADIKPDNILVSADFSTVKLCDFGSAFFETDSDNDPTPYLVSRFYRPPEVILGLEYDRSVDLWSVAVTLAELFTGAVLFPGRTNNDMLRRFMDAMGPVPNRTVRRHVASYVRMGLAPHFDPVAGAGGTFGFRRREVDKATGRPVVRVVTVTSAAPNKRMGQVVLKARSRGSGGEDRGDVLRFGELLERCLALDPARRATVREAFGHGFFGHGRPSKSAVGAEGGAAATASTATAGANGAGGKKKK